MSRWTDIVGSHVQEAIVYRWSWNTWWNNLCWRLHCAYKLSNNYLNMISLKLLLKIYFFKLTMITILSFAGLLINLTMLFKYSSWVKMRRNIYILEYNKDIYNVHLFFFAFIVQSPVPIALFFVNGTGKLMPVAIQLFQQKGPENPVRLLHTFILHHFVIHVKWAVH